MAYGVLGLRPEEFADLTPRELRLLAEGARERREDLQELLAWHAANLLAAWSKRPPTPAQLLGRPTRAMRKGKGEG